MADVAIELELMGAKCIPYSICESDIEYIMKKDYVGTGSVGTVPFYGIGLPHVRSYSTFLHKAKKYALMRKTISLPHVIRSQTSLPAQIMNWNDRGWIKEGYIADIVVFDLKNLKIKSTISNPHQYCEGVKYLFINGEIIIDHGKWNGKLPGKVLELKKTKILYIRSRLLILEINTMKVERIITIIDSHTAGEPTRIITSGLPHIPGNTMADKMPYFQENLDYIRTSIIHEPRGHKEMIGAVLLPPTRKEADFGVFYLDMDGCNSMCGHGTIGVCTTLIKLGCIPPSEPETKIVLDTPAGLVSSKLRIENGDVISANLINVPSFLYAENVRLPTSSGKINVDVAFGGNFFILVNAEDLGLNMIPENIPEFVRYASHVADEVDKEIKVVHPEEKHIESQNFVYFYGPPSNSQADSKSIVIGGRGNVDRSPCGTGTSARIAALYAQDKVSLGATFCTESIIGPLFEGKVLREKKIGKFLAIIPEITASAYITGIHKFIIESSDPLKHGFIM